jgi:hypothetical protein
MADEKHSTMTDDELRKLAEAVVALPEPNPGQHALVGVIGTMKELASAVLRLLKENEVLRLKLADVSVDTRISDLMERANALLAESNAKAKP